MMDDDAPFSPDDILAAGPATAEAVPSPKAEPAAPAAPEQPQEADDADVVDKEKVTLATEEDRDAFARHVLGSMYFQKEYTMTVAGASGIRILLRTRTMSENDEIQRELSRAARAGEISGMSHALDYILRAVRTHMAASCVGIEIDGRKYVPEGASVAERYAWFSNTFGDVQMRVLLLAQQTFEALVSELFVAATSANFSGGRAGAI